MKATRAILVCFLLVLGACKVQSEVAADNKSGDGWIRKSWDYTKQYAQGSSDMWRAYWQMRKANYKHSDKYFHARGNHEAAKRGPGGRAAAEFISNAREWTDEYVFNLFRRGPNDGHLDQIANRWGRDGGDPSIYRPNGLPLDY